MTDILWIDITLAAIMGWSMVSGLFRGLVRGIFGFVSLALAFIGARQYGGTLARQVESMLGESVFSTVAGYALVFVLLLALFSVCTLLLQKLIQKADLGALDKTGGLVFGFLRGGLFSLLAVGFLALFPLQSLEAWRQSALVPVFGSVIEVLTKSPFGKEYGRYWQFDDKRRPRLVRLSDIATDIPFILSDSATDSTSDADNDSDDKADNNLAKPSNTAADNPTENSNNATNDALQQIVSNASKAATEN